MGRRAVVARAWAAARWSLAVLGDGARCRAVTGGGAGRRLGAAAGAAPAAPRVAANPRTAATHTCASTGTAPAQVLPVLPAPGAAGAAVRAAVRGGGARAARGAVGVDGRRRRDLAGQRWPARPWPTRSWRGSAPIRPIAAAPAARACGAVAPSELFLRVAALVRLRVPRGRLAAGWLALGRPGGDVRVPALAQRHPVHRGAGAAHARRRLPRLPAHHADAVPVVSQSEHPARTAP